MNTEAREQDRGIEALHADLRRLLKAAGIEVEERVAMGPQRTRGEVGAYVSRSRGGPVHLVYRPDHSRIIDSHAHEVVSMAHSYGHHNLDVNGLRPDEYEYALQQLFAGEVLTEFQVELIIDIDQRAWRLADELLRGLAFKDWSVFHALRRDGLERLRQRFQENLAL